MKESPKYVQLADELRLAIHCGTYREGDRLPGENELSAAYGMSRQTVRQAIGLLEQEGVLWRQQGRGTFVGALPPRGRERTGNIGVIATYISEYIFPSILRGIEEELTAQKYSPLLSATGNRVERERRILEECLQKPIDGLIVEGTKTALPNPNIDLYRRIRELGLPVVFFNGCYSNLPGGVSVMTDDAGGGLQAARRLIGAGCRRLAAIFKADDIQGPSRYAGFAQGLLEQGLPLSDDAVIWFHTENREEVLGPGLAERLRDCDGLVCYNDEVAVRAVQRLQETGRRVPRDVSVVSFDNSILSELSGVRITSLEHPKEAMGRLAAQKLLRLIDGKNEAASLLEWRLVEKDSVLAR